MSKEWTTTIEGDHHSRLAIAVFALMIFTLVALAMFQSSALVTWSYDLPISSLSAIISSSAESWHAWMEHIGVASFSQSVSDTVLRLHDDWPVGD